METKIFAIYDCETERWSIYNEDQFNSYGALIVDNDTDEEPFNINDVIGSPFFKEFDNRESAEHFVNSKNS